MARRSGSTPAGRMSSSRRTEISTRRTTMSKALTSSARDHGAMESYFATGDILQQVADLLFDGGGDEVVAKMNPDSADISTHKKRVRTQARRGLAVKVDAQRKDRRTRALTAGLSAVGATAGAAGLGYAGYKTHGEYRRARPTMSRIKAIKTAVKHEKLGAALIPLEVAGLGGELMATHILHG